MLRSGYAHGMSWRKPTRAVRVAIYEEGESVHQYWRSEDQDGNVVWRSEDPLLAGKSSAETIGAAELLAAIQASVTERRRASRGRKFHL
jgi:hypothetical protein